MAHRKLQQEIDRVFKKINEGLEVFDTYYERHEACNNNPAQKEKLEADLKREVKKLQRLREQIKSWQSSSDIKDKESLLDYRRSVEIAMEKYKAVEKASKEKAYSNISLKKSDILDPEEQQRQEISNYLSAQIDELERQYDLLELEIDKLQASHKRKKSFSPQNEERIKKMKALQSRYRWHQQQMELALRLLANEELDPEKVENIKDDINFFVESNQDDDFVEDESIYNDLDLHSNEAIAHEVSQYFTSQLDDTADTSLNNDADNDATAAAGGSGNSTKANISSSTKESNDDSTGGTAEAAALTANGINSSKLSKKEQRKLEREAKKAAKLAAKNAAALIASQGPPVMVRMNSMPKVSTTTTTTTKPVSEGSSKSSSPSPVLSNTAELSSNVSSAGNRTGSNVNVGTSTPGATQNIGSHSGNSQNTVADHQSATQEQSGGMNTTTLKLATTPIKPVGEMKWSVAASLSLEKEKKLAGSNYDSSKVNHGNVVNGASSSNTVTLESLIPIKKQPSSLNFNDQGSVGPKSPKQQKTNNSSRGSSKGSSDKNKRDNKGSKHDKSDLESLTSASSSDEDFDDLFGYGYDIDQSPDSLESPEEQLQQEMKSKALEELFLDDFDILGLPSGINEFIMGYEIHNQHLDAKRSFPEFQYRRSIDLYHVERLHDIPVGVSPPNPLDAFRSTQQWDAVRCSILNDQEANESNKTFTFDEIVQKFGHLDISCLFYNYYIAVTPLEKRIALELLRRKNWKVSANETMWFLRQGEPKFRSDTFEFGDYKVFKLDDWSIVDKVNFKLDYASLKYGDTEERSRSGSNKMATGRGVNEDKTVETNLSDSQQLLQQLKLGKS